MHRRSVVTVALIAVVLSSGCLATITADVITFEASPAGVAEGTVATHGFEEVNRSTYAVQREADIPFVGTRTVRSTNHVSKYARVEIEGDDPRVAALVVVTTPQARVAGQGVNPLGRMPIRDLVTRVGDRVGGQRGIELVDTRSLAVLGEQTTVETYATTTETDRGPVETYVHVVRVAHEEDYVIAVGVHPAATADDDEAAIFELMEAIEHPAT